MRQLDLYRPILDSFDFHVTCDLFIYIKFGVIHVLFQRISGEMELCLLLTTYFVQCFTVFSLEQRISQELYEHILFLPLPRVIFVQENNFIISSINIFCFLHINFSCLTSKRTSVPDTQKHAVLN